MAKTWLMDLKISSIKFVIISITHRGRGHFKITINCISIYKVALTDFGENIFFTVRLKSTNP